MSENQRLYLSPPYMGGEEMHFIQDAFDKNWIAPCGVHVDQFENELARLAQRKYAIATSAATAAIHLALRVLGVCKDDIVFCSDLTFCGSCNPILYQNAMPVFIDSDRETYNMSPEALEIALKAAQKKNQLPKAVVVVDLYGQSADYARILPLCEQFGVPVIEDAAEALGAEYNDKPCGSMGEIGIYSFNGNKMITTSGGGMVLTNDEKYAERMRYYATQARENVAHYEHTDYGYNYRLSNICAAIGLGQLRILGEKLERRAQIYQAYRNGLAKLPLDMMPVFHKPNHWLSVFTIDADCDILPNDIITALGKENIEARPVWKPMHMQPIFASETFFTHEAKSVSEELFAHGVCLPSGEAMTKPQQEQVISIIESCFE